MTLDVTEACSRITGLYLQEVTSLPPQHLQIPHTKEVLGH